MIRRRLVPYKREIYSSNEGSWRANSSLDSLDLFAQSVKYVICNLHFGTGRMYSISLLLPEVYWL